MDSLPEDMESRRLADLERFALNHPDHPMVPLLMKQVQKTDSEEREVDLADSNEGSWYHWLRQQQLQSVRKVKRQYRVGRSAGKQGAINKWDTASSLELLGALKSFQDSLAELAIRGIRVTSESRWTTIAQNLPNRCGLEPAKYARSCKVHFLNLCRAYRAQRKNSKGEDAIDPLVRRALEDYFQLGDVNVPRLLPKKGLPVKTRVYKEESYVVDKNATNVKMSNPSPEKIHPEEHHSTIPKVANINIEKKSKRRPHEVGDSRSVDYTRRVDTTRMENHEDPHEQEEVGNPYRPDQQESPNMDSGAILKGWDTVSTLQLLAAVRKVGPKVVNRWEEIASQLDHDYKVDHQEYVRSCKKHYKNLLQIYTRENMQLHLGHKPLVDEVHAQLAKWLLLNSTTSKASHLARKEIPCVERRDTALGRVAVKSPAYNPGIINPNDGEGTASPKISEVNTKGKGRLTKANSAMRNSNDAAHLTIGLDDGRSWNYAVNLHSDSDSESEWDEYRSRLNKRSSEQDGEQQCQTMTKTPLPRNQGFTDAEDRKKNGNLQNADVKIKRICNAHTDSIVGRSNKLPARDSIKAALLNCSGLNQARNIAKKGSKDYHVHGGPHDRGRKSEVRRGGEILQRTFGDIGKEGQKNKGKGGGTSKTILCDEKLTIEGKLKNQCQADAKETSLIKTFTQRILAGNAKYSDNKGRRDGCRILEYGEIERGENSKGIMRRAKDVEKMTTPQFEPIEEEIDDKEVRKMWGTTKGIISSRTDDCIKSKAPLLYDSDSNRIQVAESDNVSSWDHSIRSEDSSRREEINSRVIRNTSTYLKEKQKTQTNISWNGKRFFSSGPQHAHKRAVERNPAADRLGNCVGLDRKLNTKFKLGSDQADSSWDDSMHLDEDNSASEGGESTRKGKKRLLILNRMTKKRAERNELDTNTKG